MRIKIKNNTAKELKQFYSSSQAYLKRLEKHDKKTFLAYVELCKKEIVKGSTILECGCGIGTSSYLLSKEGFNVIATDISPLFISEAKKKYGNQLHLEFSIADAGNMQFKDQSFDAVCSYDLLAHVVDIESVLREMTRVLKVKGQLVIFMPTHIDPIQHLMACIRWKKKQKYTPWEAKSRIRAFWYFIIAVFLVISKAIGFNRKIYYLKPVLSNDENACGKDFDSTWLANWFDIKNILTGIGVSIKYILPQSFDDRIIRTMRKFRLPKVLQFSYTKLRVRSGTLIGAKNETTNKS